MHKLVLFILYGFISKFSCIKNEVQVRFLRMTFNHSYASVPRRSARKAASEASTRIEANATDLNDDSLRDEDVQVAINKPSENELIPNKERIGPFEAPPSTLVKGKDYETIIIQQFSVLTKELRALINEEDDDIGQKEEKALREFYYKNQFTGSGSYDYLLLDATNLSDEPTFNEFISAIFYVGKATGNRLTDHIKDAADVAGIYFTGLYLNCSLVSDAMPSAKSSSAAVLRPADDKSDISTVDNGMNNPVFF
jgi:hypothetical protein